MYLRVVSVVRYIICDCSTALSTLTMTPKRHAPAKDSSSKLKRKRKMMTISEKVKLLDILKEGKSFTAEARHYGANEFTVRYIQKDEANIRKIATITVCTEAKREATPRNERIVKMKAALALWITDFWKKKRELGQQYGQDKGEISL